MICVKRSIVTGTHKFVIEIIAKRFNIEKNFQEGLPQNVRVFNYLGRMVVEELSLVHRTALKTLKKIMQGKENPTDMEKLLIELCDADGDFCDKEPIGELLESVR